MTVSLGGIEAPKMEAAEIESEDVWTRQWGLVPPAGGLLLPDPYSRPFGKRSLITPHTWFESAAGTPPAPVNPNALSADIPLLSEVMRMAYCGWETEPYSGFWDGFWAEWRHDLARYREPISSAEAFRKWIGLQRVRRDHHTGPVIAGFRWQSFSCVAVLPPGTTAVSALRSGRREFAIPAADPAAQPWAARSIRPDFNGFRPVSLIACPSDCGPVDAAFSDGAWTGAEPLEMPARDESIRAIVGHSEDLPCYRQVAPGVGYLRIPALSLRVSESIGRYEEWVPKDADAGRALVVDLRGNSGGAAASAIGLLGRFLGPKALERGLKFGFRLKRSCITDALSWGHAQMQLRDAKPPLSPAARAQLQSILDGIGESHDPGRATAFEERTAEWNYSQRVRSGPARVLILMDGDCASDGEFLAYLLAAAPASVVVGTNTAGCAQFIRPGYFILPASRIVFRIAMGASDLYGDGRTFDGYGLQVDVVLPREPMLDREILLKLVTLLER